MHGATIKIIRKAFIFTLSAESLNLLTFIRRKGSSDRLIDIYNANSFKKILVLIR